MNGIILVGKPGSGKSDLGKRLAKTLDMIYISSGDIARELSRKHQGVADSLAKGSLIDEVMMRDELYRKLYEITYAKKSFVLDGFPRFEDQFYWLLERFPSLAMIHVDVSEDECYRRLQSRNRKDDTAIAIQTRMSYYDTHTSKLISNADILLTVNGERPREEVYNNTMTFLTVMNL